MITQQQIKWLIAAQGNNTAFPRLQHICVMDSKVHGHGAFCTDQFMLSWIAVDDALQNGFYRAVKDQDNQYQIVPSTEEVGNWYDMDFILAPYAKPHYITWSEDMVRHIEETNKDEKLTVFSDGHCVYTKFWKKAIGRYKNYRVTIVRNLVKVEINPKQFSVIATYMGA